ncbi:MAG TPA: PBP1A family penicillin-binding protein [Clostridia bacterium]|nr:PBP1A family penicillin-binding protein [Clostridia bacterium]
MKRTGRDNYIASFFTSIGKPIFRLLLLAGLGLIILSSLPRQLLKLFALLARLPSFQLPPIPKLKIPRISLPRLSFPKISFPKIRLPVFKLKIPWRLSGLLLGAFFSLLIFSYGSYLIFKDLPSPQKLSKREQSLTTKIYDHDGQLLYKVYRGKNRTPVSLDQLPTYLIQATIAIEDKDFYRHPGLSFPGIIRAAYQNLFQGKKSGGSTITQQLIKNALLSSEKTWRRKIKEAILALLVEKMYAKDKILEMYLNEVGYGGSAYGIEEAAQKYFGKHAKELNLAEASLLAGLPASPTKFSPFGHNPYSAKERQATVLRRMVEDGYLTEAQREETLKEEIILAPQRIEILAPHFVMYVKDLLVQKYGEKMVAEGGLEVTTSLDLEIQEIAQATVQEEVKKLGNLRISNGAALVTNPKTGEVLAMVGSKDYFAQDIDGNVNVTTSARQPGSSIKPVNYSIALENGFTTATIIDDSAITYQVPGQPPYSPQNYDNQFHGPIPLRVALGSSYNVPAVKVLASFGVKKMVQRGQEMGITTWEDQSRFGLSLTLGSGEVKMTDMAVVYGVLANNGIRVDLNPILEVKDSKGKILERHSQGKETPVLNPGVAFLLTYILSDNSARTPAFGPNSLLYIPNRQVAVKTGTTQNMRDNWTIGYTPSFLVATWVGNNDSSSMSYVASGVTGASPIWRKIMDQLLENKPKETFNQPEEIVEVEICQPTGTLTCLGCPSVKKEYFLQGTEPKLACNPQLFEIRQEEKETYPSFLFDLREKLEKLKDKHKRD